MQLRAEHERRASWPGVESHAAAIIRSTPANSRRKRSPIECRFSLRPRLPQSLRAGVRGLWHNPSGRSGQPERRGRIRALLADETGSATAEYAVATMAAVGFAGLLVVILKGDEVRGILTDLIRRALTVAN